VRHGEVSNTVSAGGDGVVMATVGSSVTLLLMLKQRRVLIDLNRFGAVLNRSASTGRRSGDIGVVTSMVVAA